MKGPFKACGETAVDDLLDAQLLARAGRGRGVLECLLGFLPGKAASSDEAAEGVGGPVEGVGEARALGDLAAGLNRRKDRGEGALDLTAPAAGGKDGLLGARWDGAGSRNGGCGQVPGAVEFLSEPQREGSRLAGLIDGGVRAVVGRGTGAMM